MTATQTPHAGTAQGLNGGRAWVVTALLLVLMLINFADKSVLGLVAVPMTRDLGIDDSQYGLVASSFYFLFSLSSVLIGLVADRVSSTALLLGMGLLWALLQLPVAFASGVATLLVSRVLLGASEGPAFPIANHAVHKWFDDTHRGVPSALLAVGATGSAVLAAPSITWITEEFGWRAAFLTLAGVGLAWSVLWILLGREGPGHAAPRGGWRPCGGFRVLLTNRTWWAATVAAFTGYWALALNQTWAAPYLQRVLGYGIAEAGRAVVLPGVASAVLILASGAVSQRLVQRGVATRWARGALGGAALLLAGTSAILLPEMPRGLPALAALTCAFGVVGVFFPIATTILSEITPAAGRGTSIGVSTALATLAGVVAPSVMGALVGSGASTAAGFQHGWVVSGVVTLVGGGVALALIDPGRDRITPDEVTPDETPAVHEHRGSATGDER